MKKLNADLKQAASYNDVTYGDTVLGKQCITVKLLTTYRGKSLIFVEKQVLAMGLPSTEVKSLT